ncbi:MAG: hypothetical protein IAE79_06405 [Anaerolinea sp.]|nr:hypothetical protein [Anaerolinea sp.]
MAILRRNRKTAILLLLALMMVLGTAVVQAITITIDGIREAAWDGDGGQLPGVQGDPNEPDIDDRFDIREVRWTNDSTGGTPPYGFMYWLFETYDNFDYNVVSNEPLILVCLDTDNDTGTGANVSGYCNNMQGVDRRIRIFPGTGLVQVQSWNGSIFVNVATPAGGLRAVAFADADSNGIADTPYIEAGFDLQSLGITSSATCINTMRASIYYDNGIIDGEDQVTDTGSFTVSCGSPTAVTLQSITTSSSPVAALSVAAALMLVVVSAGFVLYRRQGQAR